MCLADTWSIRSNVLLNGASAPAIVGQLFDDGGNFIHSGDNATFVQIINDCNETNYYGIRGTSFVPDLEPTLVVKYLPTNATRTYSFGSRREFARMFAQICGLNEQ